MHDDKAHIMWITICTVNIIPQNEMYSKEVLNNSPGLLSLHERLAVQEEVVEYNKNTTTSIDFSISNLTPTDVSQSILQTV